MKHIDTLTKVTEDIQTEILTKKFKLPQKFFDESIGPIIVANKLNNKEYTATLDTLFGHSAVIKFFKDSSMSLSSYFPSLVASFIYPLDNGFTFDKEHFLEALQGLSKIISDGKAPYSLCYRIVNVIIPDTLVFEETKNTKIHLRMIPESQVNMKYPANEFIGPVFLPHLSKHRMEAVFEYVGLPKDMEKDISIEGGEYLEKLITNAIVLSRISLNQLPYATHTYLNSPFKKNLTYKGFKGLNLEPKLLSLQEQEKVVSSYAVLKASECDNVLHSSIDRFIVAAKQSSQHSNKVNIPNWDKIVDFAIACETLFLTVYKSSGEQELSYRFKLNGSSLLSKVVATDKRILFSALAELYKMRSKIVHGCNEKEIIKPANKFIKLLDIDDKRHKHDIGRLILICTQLEEWLSLIFEYITGIDIDERPYQKNGGWEDLLWG